MSDARPAIPFETIEKSIWLIRGQKIILDADLAALYGVDGPGAALHPSVGQVDREDRPGREQAMRRANHLKAFADKIPRSYGPVQPH